ncbi:MULTISPECIES: hypothetical protein [unclassified Neochlamydia]|uniref:hypothetical protein n=1 Tax=unclassified Neochlamydia TaxID=2643326 RepID=UPI00140A4276|nr:MULTISPECIES: hypothetical protein [unclassified Neochlamydia]MBS4169461.1 Uncharacterized protein [Neochlamydia sp. AcF95]NGY95602.1 hypothetical protein [Neochlamydia sp. AcF84]
MSSGSHINSSLESTLNAYYDLYSKTKENKNDRGQRPILLLRTANGEKTLQVLSDRSQLSFLQKILAYLGKGEASLSNVANFLREKNPEIKDTTARKALQHLDEKIVNLNARRWICHIDPLFITKTMSIQSWGCEASATYHSEDTEQGVLDFVHVFPECATAYIADGTGHGNPGVRANKLEPIWNKFNGDFVSKFKSEMLGTHDKDQVLLFMKSVLLDINTSFEIAGTASTFSMAIILEIDQKKYVCSAHVGDSSLWHETRGEIHRLTPESSLELSSLSKNSSIHLEIKEVQTGDKIYGFTDGVTDFLPAEILHSILCHQQIDPIHLLEEIKAAIVHPTFERDNYVNIKKLDPTDKNSSDDIAAFIMVVP